MTETYQGERDDLSHLIESGLVRCCGHKCALSGTRPFTDPHRPEVPSLTGDEAKGEVAPKQAAPRFRNPETATILKMMAEAKHSIRIIGGEADCPCGVCEAVNYVWGGLTPGNSPSGDEEGPDDRPQGFKSPPGHSETP